MVARRLLSVKRRLRDVLGVAPSNQRVGAVRHAGRASDHRRAAGQYGIASINSRAPCRSSDNTTAVPRCQVGPDRCQLRPDPFDLRESHRGRTGTDPDQLSLGQQLRVGRQARVPTTSRKPTPSG